MLAFDRAQVWDKIHNLPNDFKLMAGGVRYPVPWLPARDIQVLPPHLHPDKKGLSSPEGQARLLHDLASIELQAMELGVRTLNEFPEAPRGFRQELEAITQSEAEHLSLCLNGLKDLGFEWGHWPVHCSLWSATSSQDSLLDRILIVHRYLEGSGLDAGDHLLRRLEGVKAPQVREIIQIINTDEVSHVDFGSRWYREIAQQEGLDPLKDFETRMEKIRAVVPKRLEKLAIPLRKKAGFTDAEIQILTDYMAKSVSAAKRESLSPMIQRD